QFGRRLGFGLKALHLRATGQLAGENHFERHGPIQAHLARAEHDPHPPRARSPLAIRSLQSNELNWPRLAAPLACPLARVRRRPLRLPTPVGAGRWGSCPPARRRASPARTADISSRSARIKRNEFQLTHYKRKKREMLHRSFEIAW